MRDGFARKAITLLAKILLQTIYIPNKPLTNEEYDILSCLSDGDFSVLDGEE